MLTTTFYSFKGGVGRTRALLNVAQRLARTGVSVVAVDLDLEAPGFDNAEVCEPGELGVSDYVVRLLSREEPDIYDYLVRPNSSFADDQNLHLMRAGTLARQLAALIPSLYGESGTAGSSVFQRLLSQIETTVNPDILLIDSRTGLADIAGVCTVELPELVVLFTSLDPQSVEGIRGVATQIQSHLALNGRMPPGYMLVYANIPRAPEGDFSTREAFGSATRPRQGPLDALAPVEPDSHPVLSRLVKAHNRLDVVYGGFDVARKRLQTLKKRDLVHFLEYDPMAHLHVGAVGGEGKELAEAYDQLTLALAHGVAKRIDEVSNTPWIDLARLDALVDGA